MVLGVVTAGANEPVLKRTSISGAIRHSFCSLDIVQHYRNDATTASANCVLHINGCANLIVSGVRVSLPGQPLDFGIRELTDGPQAYAAVVSGGNESSDALHLELGNVPPETEFQVHFTCCLTAIMSDNSSLRFSMPRNAGATPLEMTLDVQQLSEIKSVVMRQSEFAYTATGPQEGRVDVSAASVDDNKEVSVVVHLADPVETAAIATRIDGSEYIGVSAVADIPSKEDLKCDLYLMIDCSASMSGHSIVTARNTLTYFLKSLPKSCMFNVIRFGSSFQCMFRQSVQYTQKTLSAALERVNLMNADLGGTDLYSPISYIFDRPTVPGYCRQVFVLTDGQVPGEAEIIALATRNRRNHRIFSVGIGSSVARTFIEDLAAQTGGEAAFVTSAGDGAMTATMSQLKSALRPAMVDNELHLSQNETFEVAPFPLPTLFHNVLTHAFVRVSKASEDTSLLLSGRAGDKQFELAAVVTRVRPGVRLDTFFGYFNIRDMEERIPLAPEPEVRVIKQRVVRLSMQTGIVSQFTGLCTAVRRPAPVPEQRLTVRQQRAQRAWDDRQCGQKQCQQAAQPWATRQQAQARTRTSVPLDPIQSIVSSQAFDGYWDSPVRGCDQVKWNDLQVLAPFADRRYVRQTVHALAVLEKTAAKQKVLWELVAEKAKEWLQSQDATLNWDDVIRQVAALIH
jgi:hypothetical protein